jgi:hypothetical protein
VSSQSKDERCCSWFDKLTTSGEVQQLTTSGEVQQLTTSGERQRLTLSGRCQAFCPRLTLCRSS